MNDIYKKASRGKIRFQTNKGSLATEQLWDLTVIELDAVVVALEKDFKKSGEKTFIPNASETPKDKVAKLRFEVALDVLQTKVKDQERASKANETRMHNQRIDELIAQKKEGAMAELSVEELEKLRRQ